MQPYPSPAVRCPPCPDDSSTNRVSRSSSSWSSSPSSDAHRLDAARGEWCPRGGPAGAVPEQSQAIWVALHAYHNDFDAFPVGNFAANVPAEPTPPVQLAGGWWAFQARLLPYMESKDIYDLCNFSYPGDCFDWIATSASSNEPRRDDPQLRQMPRRPVDGTRFGRSLASAIMVARIIWA